MPDYALGAHTASLGLAWSEDDGHLGVGARFTPTDPTPLVRPVSAELVRGSGGALPESFRGGMFVGQHGSWNRKPRSGFDGSGALLVADDVGNTVWRVTAAP